MRMCVCVCALGAICLPGTRIHSWGPHPCLKSSAPRKLSTRFPLLINTPSPLISIGWVPDDTYDIYY